MRKYPYDQSVYEFYQRPTAHLVDLLGAQASRFTHSIAFRHGTNYLTFGVLNSLSSSLAAILQLYSVQAQDQVMIMLPNSLQFVLAFFGSLKANTVITLVNPGLTDQELSLVIQKIQPKYIFMLEKRFQNSKKIIQQCRSLRKIFTTSTYFSDKATEQLMLLNFKNNAFMKWSTLIKRKLNDWVGKAPSTTSKSQNNEDENIVHFEELIFEINPFYQHRPITMNDPSVILLTSGLAFDPKAVVLSQQSIMENINQIRSWFFMSQEGQEKALGLLPFFNSFGLTIGLGLSIKMATEVIIVSKLDYALIKSLLHFHKPSLFAVVPSLLQNFLQSGQLEAEDFKSLYSFFCGGAALPLHLKKKIEDKFKRDIIEGYGVTEASPVVAVNPIFGKRKVGSVGLPLPGTEVKIQLEEGQDRMGELWVRGPQMSLGYLGKNNDIQDCLNSERWFQTGDLFWQDDEGFLFWQAKMHEVIFHEKEMISISEIENILIRFNGIKELACLAEKTAEKRVILIGYIVLKENSEEMQQNFIAYCKQNLAAHKFPQKIYFVKELIKNSIIQVMKKELFRLKESAIRVYDAEIIGN